MTQIHPSVAGLYEAARLRGHDAPAVVARALNVSAQRLQNWEERGISKEGALAAQRLYGADANELLEGRFKPMATKSRDRIEDPADEIHRLRERVDSLTIVLGALFSVTAQHRPMEAAKLAGAITGNELLDLSQHPEVQTWVSALNVGQNQAAKPSARARARSS